jgi:hypothetical protein
MLTSWVWSMYCGHVMLHVDIWGSGLVGFSCSSFAILFKVWKYFKMKNFLKSLDTDEIRGKEASAQKWSINEDLERWNYLLINKWSPLDARGCSCSWNWVYNNEEEDSTWCLQGLRLNQNTNRTGCCEEGYIRNLNKVLQEQREKNNKNFMPQINMKQPKTYQSMRKKNPVMGYDDTCL